MKFVKRFIINLTPQNSFEDYSDYCGNINNFSLVFILEALFSFILVIDFHSAKLTSSSCFRSDFIYTNSNPRTITEPVSRLSDDPFVTCDDDLSTNTSTPTSLKKQDSFESPSKDVVHKKRNSKSLPLRNDGTLDYDGELNNSSKISSILK